MTPKVYTDVFKDLGRNYEDYFEMINLDPIYNVFYADNSQYSFYRDLKKQMTFLKVLKVGFQYNMKNFSIKP
jgi:phytoene desaturase